MVVVYVGTVLLAYSNIGVYDSNGKGSLSWLWSMWVQSCWFIPV